MMKKLISFLLCLSILFSLPVSAFAYKYLGNGYWTVGGSNVTYQYNSDLPEAYKEPIYWGAWMWEQYCNYKPTQKTYGMINTMAYGYGATNWNAITVINGQTSGPFDTYYSSANIQFNRYYMDSMDIVQKKIIACHEFGHTGSLAHVDNKYCMMYTPVLDAYATNPNLRYQPSADDINGMNNRY